MCLRYCPNYPYNAGMAQSPLLTVGVWQKKSLEASCQSKDRLISAVNKGFDAMAAVLTKDSDPDEVQCALEYLSSERSIALKFDKTKCDTLRDLVYGLLESLHGSLKEWTAERNQKKGSGEISTQIEEESPLSLLEPLISPFEASLPIGNNSLSTLPPNSSSVFPIEPKDELMDDFQAFPHDCQISASELMRDEKLLKEEEMGIANEEGMPAHYQPFFPDLLDLLEKVSQNFTVDSKSSGFYHYIIRESRMDDGTVGEENSYHEQPSNILHDHSYCIESPMDDRTVGEENSYYEEPSNILHDHTYCSIVQKNPSGNKGDTEMKCPKDEYRPQKASSWVNPLSNKHFATPALCDFENFTVTRPVMQANKTTPQCILCDHHPTTPKRYIDHLAKSHNTTLRAYGVFIICSCGDKFYSNSYIIFHRKKCNKSHQFKVYKEIFEDCPSSLVEPKEESVENEILNQSEDILVDEKLFRNDYESCTEEKVSKEEDEEMMQQPTEFSLDFPHHDDNLVEYSDDDDISGQSNEGTKHAPEMRMGSEWKSPGGGIFPSVLVTKYRTDFTTPTLAGGALLCNCGNESFSKKHSRMCNISNFTVLRDPSIYDPMIYDGPIKRISNEKCRGRGFTVNKIEEK